VHETALLDAAGGSVKRRRPAASRPRVAWRPNPDGAVRTLLEAKAIARRNGVDIDESFFEWCLADLPAHVVADYGRTFVVGDTGLVLSWDDFVTRRKGTDEERLVVRIARHALGSDDAILAAFVHEVSEVRALEEELARAGGRMTVRRLLDLVDPDRGRLHSWAWDRADEIVLALQRSNRWP
jgi:hypothetical protein